MVTTDIIFYILIFLGIFIQIFFFLTLFLDRKKLVDYKLATDGELPDVTFLIPCWNESKTIADTIASIRELDYAADQVHMVIIDDGSTDTTWEVLQRYKDDQDITLLHQENGGKTKALQHGLNYVKTELMCSIDADTFLNKDALRKIVTHMIRRPELVSVGGTVLIHQPQTFVQSAQSVDYQMFSFTKKMLGLLDGVLVAPGAFSLYKTSALREVGGYQEGHGLEDLELTFRFQSQKMKVDQSHTAIAHTTGPRSLRALFRQRLRWSYGFLNNAFDYRRVLFNRDFGIFGFFTVPMGIAAYFIIIYMFLISWYFVFRSLTETIAQVQIQGFDSLFGTGFDFFFFGTRPVGILVIMMYGFILLTILAGRKLYGVKTKDYHRIIIFVIVYSFLVPFWILRSATNFVLAKRPAWR